MSLVMSSVPTPEHAFRHGDSEDCVINSVEQFQTSMSSSQLKRPFPEEDVQDMPQTGASAATAREASPTLSTVSSSLTSLSGTPAPANPDGSSNPAQPPSKRRKLTPTERAAREREKAEKQARRDEEKQKRDEERRQKNEVLEEKKRERELKKQEKDEAKRIEDEEKAKKERAQSRINSFFAKPKPSPQFERSPRIEVSSNSTPEPAHASAIKDQKGGQATPSKPPRVIADYDKTFLPFAAPSHSTVARPNYFTWDEEYTQKALQDADNWFTPDTKDNHSEDLAKCLDFSPWEAPERGWVPTPVTDLVRRIDGSTSAPVDLTGDSVSPSSDARAQLKEQPMKYLFFHQDVRPPYIGTSSKIKTRSEALRIARRPTKEIREELDYDDDSEAEWEEPEEGEELGSEGEDDDESLADGEELGEFLDDEGTEDAQRPRKRCLYGDMQPVSSGLCWENEESRFIPSLRDMAVHPHLYRMETLSVSFDFPIDPFSTAYWPVDTKSNDAKALPEVARPPLLPLPNIHINGGPPAVSNDSVKAQKPQKPSKQLRLLSGQELEDFKQIVEGSDLTKQGLLAIVKKKLPKVPNAVLSDTLSTVAARVGAKEADKRWVIVPANP